VAEAYDPDSNHSNNKFLGLSVIDEALSIDQLFPLTGLAGTLRCKCGVKIVIVSLILLDRE
jgi:hypothetical protein